MEANTAHYCLHKLHKWPHEYLELETEEQAYIMAAVEMELEKDKKAVKEAQRKGKTGRI